MAAMAQIQREAETDPDWVKGAPHHRPVRRLDEVRAARDPAYLEALLRRMGWVRKDEEVRRWP